MKHVVLKRFLLLITGLLIMSFGVSLSTKADLGTSPISCVPFVLQLGLPLSMGLITFIMNAIFVLLQILLLRSKFQIFQLLQLVVAGIFSLFTDITMHIVSGIEVTSYAFQWGLCFISITLIAIGVSMQVSANLVMMAGEGLIAAIAQIVRKDFGKVKVAFDIILVLCGVFISFFMLHSIVGVREGTVAAALLVGTIVRYILKRVQLQSFSMANRSM